MKGRSRVGGGGVMNTGGVTELPPPVRLKVLNNWSICRSKDIKI